MNFTGLKSKGYESPLPLRLQSRCLDHGIPEMLGLVQTVPVDMCSVYHLKNHLMKKDYETGIAGICFACIVLMIILIVIFQ
jgi:hypothetical protein